MRTSILTTCTLAFLLLSSCKKSTTPSTVNLSYFLESAPSIEGKQEYLSSPFVTAGDRIYMVGHQDGSFPEIGWHIKGEMGGIWDHPIKLMDGFEVSLIINDRETTLDEAQSFTNYPMANQHTFQLDEHDLQIERCQFVPDHKEGLVVQYVLINKSDQAKKVKLQFTGHADLRPTWLGERTKMKDGQDETYFIEKQDAYLVKDTDNPWFTIFGADQPSAEQINANYEYEGKGVAARLNYELNLVPGDSNLITFFIAGSYQSKNAAINTFQDLKANYPVYLKQKKGRYEVLANQSKLSIPDKDIEQAFEWLKYNCDWLIRTVPEVGTGIMAGIPDYPWWFGVDSEYALKGYMAIGQEEAVIKTIALLDSISEATNGNGRIVHEVSTNGAVFNPGNINETPQFASLIWEIYRWNGDQAFLERYFPTIQKGLDWLMTENDNDKNGFPEGFGMMEIHGLDSEMIDVAAYTQRAFADAAQIADILNKQDLATQYETRAIELKRKINEQFWSAEFNSYADFIGTDEQALHLIEDAIVRADTLNKPWAVKELQQSKQQILSHPSEQAKPFVMHHNWVVNTPMEMGIADQDKALVALETATKFVNPFGVFVTGIDRDESAGSDDGSFKGSKIFSYTGAVMTLPTGVQIVAENNYGRPDKALNYLQRMTRSFNYAFPGSMYEVSPDYGMITQAWNIYGFAVPIVQQFFGIQPDAAQKEVIIQPNMPKAWDDAALENVIVNENAVSLFYKKRGKRTSIKAKQTKTDWNLKLVLKDLPPTALEVRKGTIELVDGQLVISSNQEIELLIKDKD
ncbi:MAG: hypothetical protein MI974_18955 [Chitinophagales bacterium]|nr:hypothetical protein [Chitinophagales bacterium]